MESEDKHSVRLTTIAGSEAVSENDMYKGLFMISLQSFGNQHMQIENFSEKVVRDYKWATTSQINEIKNLCWALPGPTLYQMIITLTTLKLQSMKAGFLAFIIFNIPSWTLLFILGTLVSIYASDYEVTQVKLAFLGFNAAAAGVMMRNLIDYVKQYSKSIPMIVIMGSSALIFWYFRSPHSIVFCLIAGAIFSLYIEMESKQQMSQRSQNLFHRINTGWLLGKNSFYIFIGLFALLWFIASHDGKVWYSYSYIFYFCGAFVIGPATTVFAYIYAFVHELNLIPDHLFWVGLPFAFLLPGSVVNGVLYFGVLLDGFRGMMVAAISFYIPCFITLYGILPNWKYYREKPGVQRLTKGLACVSTGLMIALVCIDQLQLLITLEHCAKIDQSSTYTIFVVSIFLNYVWGYYSFLVILIGGFLANARRWGLIYYRFEPDHPY